MSAAQRKRAGQVSSVEQQAIGQAMETGVALHQRGLFDDAERLYSGILKLVPKHFDALHLLGVIHQQRGDSENALKLIGSALELNDASADAHSNNGKVLLHLRRFDDALVSIERALALAPDHPQALINRATIRIEHRQFADALVDAVRVLKKDPDSVDAWTKRGNVLVAVGEAEQAIASYDKALAIRPDHAEALNNRCCLLGDIGRTEEALAGYDRVLEVNPHHVEAWINRGHMLVELHREEDGLASYQQAQALAPQHPDAMFNEGINRLRLGEFERGWDNYEQRWLAKDFTHTKRRYSLPLWNGEALQGPLLVSGEQGLGDQILFSSMLPDLAARVPDITLEVEPRLIPLFARSFPGVTFIPLDTAHLYDGPAAAQIPIGSLGRHFRPEWNSFPVCDNGYLRCDSDLSARLRQRLADGRTVIGLSWWSRNPRYQASKSAALHDFAALFELPNCRFIDLQYGDTSTEREALQRDLGVTIERLPDVDNSNDIDALASLISACDIVVTVSNTTAHLAGALGKETYVLVASGRGRMWCWFRDRDDSAFYPHMRLIRQKPKQPWTELATGIAADIAARNR